MSANNDGGPAFPIADACYPNGQVVIGTSGMSLRDWFASKCPLTPTSYAGVYGMPLTEILREGGDHAKVFWALYSDERYAYADAMLAAKEARK